MFPPFIQSGSVDSNSRETAPDNESKLNWAHESTKGDIWGELEKNACVKVLLIYDFKWQNKLNFYLFFHLYTFKFY